MIEIFREAILAVIPIGWLGSYSGDPDEEARGAALACVSFSC